MDAPELGWLLHSSVATDASLGASKLLFPSFLFLFIWFGKYGRTRTRDQRRLSERQLTWKGGDVTLLTG